MPRKEETGMQRESRVMVAVDVSLSAFALGKSCTGASTRISAKTNRVTKLEILASLRNLYFFFPPSKDLISNSTSTRTLPPQSARTMGTGKKEASRKERQGRSNDGMANVKVKVLSRPLSNFTLNPESHIFRARISTVMPKRSRL
jgi:hypothetical protein